MSTAFYGSFHTYWAGSDRIWLYLSGIGFPKPKIQSIRIAMTAKISTFFLAWLLSFQAFSQDFKKQFGDALQNRDQALQEKILREWKSKSPNDPELYVSTFNFHVNKGRSETLALTTQQQSDETLVLQDSTGATAGFMGTVVNYAPDEVKKAIAAIDKGISLHPKRLGHALRQNLPFKRSQRL